MTLINEHGEPINEEEKVQSNSLEEMKVYVNRYGEYYASSSGPKSPVDSWIQFPSKNLLGSLSMKPGQEIKRMIVHEKIIQEGNGEGSRYTNTGVSPL